LKKQFEKADSSNYPIACNHFLVLPSLLLRASIFDYVPGLDNDEIEFWHEILTFSKYGFSSGYYTIDDSRTCFPFTPYGVHGPIFPTIYGFIAHFVGWTTYLPSSLMRF